MMMVTTEGNEEDNNEDVPDKDDDDDNPPPQKRIKLGTPKEVEVVVQANEDNPKKETSSSNNNIPIINGCVSLLKTPLDGQRALIKKSILRSTTSSKSSTICSSGGNSSFNNDSPSSGSKKWPLVFDASSPIPPDFLSVSTSTTPQSILKNLTLREDQEDFKGLIARCRRVRIVEEFDKESNSENDEGIKVKDSDEDTLQLEEEDEESTPTSDIFQTNFAGERMTWVRVDLMRTVDFENSVTESFVLSKRTLLTKKFSVEIGHSFIDSATLNALVETKNAIDALGGGYEYEKAARRRITLCRNVSPSKTHVIKNDDWANFCKLEKLDAATNFSLSKTPEGDVFSFGEIHGKSRGFSEYIINKLKNGVEPEPTCKGFAFQSSLIPVVIPSLDYMEKPGILFSSTIKSSKEVKETDAAQKPNTALFKETKGDILNIETTDSYVKNIQDETGGKGVNLLVVDNEEAFFIPELVREVRFQKQIFCQVMIALLAVREGGALVLKMFDAFTPFTVGLLFILHRCFSHVSFHRLSDSSFSTERFCVCVGKRPQNGEVEEWTQFLLRIHGPATRVEEMKGQAMRSRGGSRIFGQRRRRRAPQQDWSNGVSEIVPAAVMTSHADFFAVLRRSNVETSQSVVKEVANFVETETEKRSME